MLSDATNVCELGTDRLYLCLQNMHEGFFCLPWAEHFILFYFIISVAASMTNYYNMYPVHCRSGAVFMRSIEERRDGRKIKRKKLKKSRTSCPPPWRVFNEQSHPSLVDLSFFSFCFKYHCFIVLISALF